MTELPSPQPDKQERLAGLIMAPLAALIMAGLLALTGFAAPLVGLCLVSLALGLCLALDLLPDMKARRRKFAPARAEEALSEAVDGRERRIVHAALHDSLTDLPNRTFFIEKLERAIARQGPESRTLVALIDLDDLARINHDHGDLTGDALLREVGRRLQDRFPDAMVARLGGDEFAVLLAGLSSSADCASLAHGLHGLLNGAIALGGGTITLGTSMGLAIGPGDGQEGKSLLHHAEMALHCAQYERSEDGRSTYHFFEACLDAQVRRRRQLERDLGEALAQGHLALAYLPSFSLVEKRIVSCEALLRWNHPVHGAIQPCEFIPVAEESGLIVPIGEWVLREACTRAARWGSELAISVNLSRRQFSHPGLPQCVLQALAGARLPPHRLELEVTERVLLEEGERGLATMAALRKLGVRIALDDFGTGHSSLHYLRAFPVDKFKIDGSFVRHVREDRSARAIIRSVTTLAQALDVQTLAEGVESVEDLELLAAQGCDLVQGFAISPPIPAQALPALLAANAPATKRRAGFPKSH